MMLANVPLFFGMTAWFPVLETRFQWSRAQLALAFSLTRVEGSVSGPLAGYLIDKLGPRRMVRIGLLIMGGGFLLFSQIQKPVAVLRCLYRYECGGWAWHLAANDDCAEQLVHP